MNKINKGLRLVAPDKRDFSFAGVFGQIDISQIPDFNIEVRAENQENSDYCSSYAITSASEVQEGVQLDPIFQYAMTKKIEGNYLSWGASLGDACKSAVKYGSIELKDALFNLATPKEIAANWNNYPKELVDKAKAHAKKTFFSAGTTFEQVISAIYQSKNPAITGALWRNEWTRQAVIPKEYGDDGFGHAFVFTGKRVMNGVIELIATLSNGDIGDKGKFYFSKEIFEKECTYGTYLFTDMPRSEAEQKLMLNKIYETAKASLGKDMALTQKELGCAEALNAVFKLATGREVGGGVSTYRMYQSLLWDKDFIEIEGVQNCQKGDIIISPTGYGQGFGHVGIISEDNKIMSNNSSTGLWDEHWTTGEWWLQYKTFPIKFFRYQTKTIEEQKISLLQQIVEIYHKIIGILITKK